MTTPRLPFALQLALRLAVRADLRGEIEGDLLELLARRRMEHARFAALKVWRDLASIVWRRPRARRVRVPSLGSQSMAAAGALGAVGRDARLALRGIGRRPAFAALAIGTMALGIGAAVTAFTVCDDLLIRPLPYPDPDRVVFLGQAGYEFSGNRVVLNSTLADSPAFAHLGLYEAGGLNLDGQTTSDRIRAAAVSSGFFDVLGAHALEGRTLGADDDRNAAQVAVIAFNAWRTRFGGRRVIGETIRLNDRAFTIVGVMPRGFQFPDDTDVWIPPLADEQITGLFYSPFVIARLAPGATIANARDAVAHTTAALGLGVSGAGGARLGFRSEPDPAAVRPLQDSLTHDVRPRLIFVVGLAALLLAVTATNLAGLWLGRTETRAREMRVRAALGAGALRLAVHVGLEVFALATTGSVIGTGLAAAALRVLPVLMPDLATSISPPALDMRFALLAIATTTITGVVVAIVPALAGSRLSIAANVGDRASTSRAGASLRSAIIVVQLALTFALVIGTSAAAGVLITLARVDLGFGNDRAMTFDVTLPRARYADLQTISAFTGRTLDRLRRIPDVTTAAAATIAPGQASPMFALTVNADPPAATHSLVAPINFVTPQYFDAMGIRFRAGRTFGDAGADDLAAIVSMGDAKRLWGGAAQAIGARVHVPLRLPAPLVVIGVVDDTRLRGPDRDGGQIYLPFDRQMFFGPAAFVVATRGDLAALPDAIRLALRDVAPDVAAYDVMTVRDVAARFLAGERATLTIASALAALALMLSVIGIYGVLSQTVVRQTHDIGIRLALGADARGIRRRIVTSGLRLAAAGVFAGAIVGALLMKLGAAILPRLTFPHATTLALDAGVLIVAAVAAAWVPARRASRVDPIVALRHE